VYKVKIGTKTTRNVKQNSFSKDISDLIVGGYEPDIESAQCNLLSDKMKIILNMLGASMKHQIHRQVGSTQIITTKNRWSRLMNTRILEHRLDPDNFGRAIGKHFVLCLGTRTRDRRLLVRAP
jgi:hypothetical protein